MNNFLVSQKENKRYDVWLWVIVLAALVISVWPVTVTPITGYNGLDAMQELLTADYIRIPFTAIYWIAFFWMLWQITAHVSKQHRWLKTALWMAICSGIAMVLAGWLVPMPDGFSSEMEWRQVGIGILSVLFEVGMKFAGSMPEDHVPDTFIFSLDTERLQDLLSCFRFELFFAAVDPAGAETK